MAEQANNTHQTSDAVDAPACSMTSGATASGKAGLLSAFDLLGMQTVTSLQYGLPTTLKSRSLLSLAVRLILIVATPKSASLTRPSLMVKMLAPLMSRWMTPCSCR